VGRGKVGQILTISYRPQTPNYVYHPVIRPYPLLRLQSWTALTLSAVLYQLPYNLPRLLRWKLGNRTPDPTGNLRILETLADC